MDYGNTRTRNVLLILLAFLGSGALGGGAVLVNVALSMWR
jgi:hypothetical protein